MHTLFLLIMARWHWLTIMRLYLKFRRQFKSKIRRWWVKPFIKEMNRNMFGAYETAFLYFFENDHEEFYDMVRMTPDDFEELHNVIGPHLRKFSRRRPLSTRLRLALTLK